ncbi:MAG: hypothetical protein IPL55_13500 [Saprospiraceae bacterium]|jgi:hypothetical protein|nr:hypothetical protein [Saprospiraceae bacterium]
MEEKQNLEQQNPPAESPIIIAAPKKKWSFYIKEFIMLFLAEFCRFIYQCKCKNCAGDDAKFCFYIVKLFTFAFIGLGLCDCWE